MSVYFDKDWRNILIMLLAEMIVNISKLSIEIRDC